MTQQTIPSGLNSISMLASVVGILAVTAGLAHGSIGLALAAIAAITFIGAICASINEMTKD